MTAARLATLLAAAVVWIAWATVAHAASCSSPKHTITLSNGTVTPASGSTSQTFSFSVRYRDNAGCAPGRVAVTVAGATYQMSTTGTSFTTGVTYRRSVRLPVGTYRYSFTASGGSGKGATTARLTITSPTWVKVYPPPTP